MDNNYNMEDTAKLMTMSSRGGKTRKIILIAVAVLLVAAIAFIGIRMLGGNKYDDQLKIAGKALKEGDYQTAEAEYLKAAEMNKRDPKARKGLAFAYVMEKKNDEAARTYRELADEENDKEIKVILEEAADEAEEGRPLIDEEIFPLIDDENEWLTLPAEMTPDPEGMERFLGIYGTFWWFNYEFDRSGSKFEDYQYDCEHPGESYALQLTYDLAREGYLTGDFGDLNTINEGSDPEGWSQDGYRTIDEALMDEAFTTVFNTDGDGVQEARDSAAERKWLYARDGVYYVFEPLTSYYPIKAEVSRIWLTGGKVCVEYDLVLEEMSEGPLGSFPEEKIDTFYAVLGRGVFNGQKVWTMYKNGKEKPEGVDEEPEAEDDKTSAAVEYKSAYAEVLRQNEEYIRAYNWQFGVEFEDKITDNVLLYDLNADGTPELLFFSAPEKVGYGDLHVYTMQGGKAVECSYGLDKDMRNGTDEGLLRDAAVAAGTRYMVYTGKDPGTFYLAHFMGDMYSSFYSVKCRMDGKGNITEENYVFNYTVEPEGIDEYTVDGKSVSADEASKVFKAHREDYGTLLLWNGYHKDMVVFEKVKTDKPAATNYDDVMAKLQ